MIQEFYFIKLLKYSTAHDVRGLMEKCYGRIELGLDHPYTFQYFNHENKQPVVEATCMSITNMK